MKTFLACARLLILFNENIRMCKTTYRAFFLLTSWVFPHRQCHQAGRDEKRLLTRGENPLLLGIRGLHAENWKFFARKIPKRSMSKREVQQNKIF